MDGVEPSESAYTQSLTFCFIPVVAMQARPFAASHMALSLSLYQVTVLGVLHGICTRVAWFVENIKLSRIVCINGLCQARDCLVRTLRQFVDVLRLVAARRVLAISPHGLNAGARVLSRYCT